MPAPGPSAITQRRCYPQKGAQIRAHGCGNLLVYCGSIGIRLRSERRFGRFALAWSAPRAGRSARMRARVWFPLNFDSKSSIGPLQCYRRSARPHGIRLSSAYAEGSKSSHKDFSRKQINRSRTDDGCEVHVSKLLFANRCDPDATL
jgi:hypothetical protein